MRILVVHGQKLEHYPPVLSLLEVLTRSGHKVTIITKCEDEPKVTNLNYLTVIRLPENNNQRNFIFML